MFFIPAFFIKFVFVLREDRESRAPMKMLENPPKRNCSYAACARFVAVSRICICWYVALGRWDFYFPSLFTGK